jgi:hypothetical protein
MSFVELLARRRESPALLLAAPFPADAQWHIPSPVEGKSELRVGIRAKFLAESRDTTSSEDAVRGF